MRRQVHIAVPLVIALVGAVICLLYGGYCYFQGAARGTGTSTKLLETAIYQHLQSAKVADLPYALCTRNCRDSLQKAEVDFGKVEDFHIAKVEPRIFGIPVKVSVFVKRSKAEGIEELYRHSIGSGIGSVDVLHESLPSTARHP